MINLSLSKAIILVVQSLKVIKIRCNEIVLPLYGTLIYLLFVIVVYSIIINILVCHVLDFKPFLHNGYFFFFIITVQGESKLSTPYTNHLLPLNHLDNNFTYFPQTNYSILARYRDWSLITGRGLQNGKIVGPKLVVAPTPRPGKTFRASLFKGWKLFAPPPPSVLLKLQAPVLKLPSKLPKTFSAPPLQHG